MTGAGPYGTGDRADVRAARLQRGPDGNLQAARNTPKYYKALNDMTVMRYGGPFSEEYKLCEDGSIEHTWPEIVDRLLKDRFGRSTGWNMFAKKACHVPKRKEDVYWKWFNPSRVPSISNISSTPASR